MTALIGTAALWCAAAVAVIGIARPGRHGRVIVISVASALALATLALAWALVTNDYSLEYVAQSARRDASAPYRLAGLWGGMSGSLLLWTAFVAIWGMGAARVAHPLEPRAARGVTRALNATTLVFLVPLLTVSRPFATLARPVVDGTGLNAVLEHPAMLYHPPLLYLGLTALFPLAVLAAAAVDVRRRLLVATAVLGAGMLAGAHWAYQELGWGGFWAWDPIENAALLPWLVAVAALHDRRGVRRQRVLVIVAAVLAGAGAFLTRSGATVSVHAFGEARAVGWLVLAGLVTMSAVAAVVVAAQARTDARGRIPVAVTALIVPALVIALGTFPPAAMGVFDRPRVVDARFFTMFAVPLLLAGTLLCGWQLRRRGVTAGAATAHAGVVVIALGAVASSFGSSATVALRVGEPVDVRGTRVELLAVETADLDARPALTAVVRVDGRTLRPALRSGGAGPSTSETAIVSTLAGDRLLTPRRIDASGLAVLDVHRKPLVPWVWLGALAIVGGTLLSLRNRRRPPAASARADDRASLPARRAQARLVLTAPPAEPVPARSTER